MVKDENPEASFGEIGKILGAKWGEADEKTKKKVRGEGPDAEAGQGREDGRPARPGRSRQNPNTPSARQYNELHDADKKRYDEEMAACVPARFGGRAEGGHVPCARGASVTPCPVVFASRVLPAHASYAPQLQEVERPSPATPQLPAAEAS